MTSKSPRFDQTFLDGKRRQLMKLREQLQGTADTGEAEEAGLKGAALLQAHEYEDDAQKLAMLETEGNLLSREIERLSRVERALRKIEEGTYGFSDVSGKAIPEARLEATPDAINTVQEQEASERA
ncbi:MAG: TraR/DksA family transcriptional regulator [Gammaproteobacteria bacterium]